MGCVAKTEAGVSSAGSASSIDIFLQPGEFHFGDRDTCIRTLLGSCVAITLWHPRFRIGGMCHYLLPGRRRWGRSDVLDGRYADNAMLMFLRELARTGTRPCDYEVKMFGGGNQFDARSGGASISVPDRNIEAGRELLVYHGFVLKAEHLGGCGHRNVIFEIATGDVWMRHVDTAKGARR
jgi:chemotaxis protein CheD